MYAMQLRHIEQLIKDPERAENQVKDSAKLKRFLLITIFMRIFRLITNIMFLSYFCGLFWHICSDLIVQFHDKQGDPYDQADHFITAYSIDTLSLYQRTIALMYFMFTTLTTVGLGDFHPKSDLERIVCSFIMLFGVMVTSLLMTEFSEMIKKLSEFDKNHEEQDRFNMFLTTF